MTREDKLRVDLLIKVACLVKMFIMFAISKETFLDRLVHGGQLY